MTFEEKVEKLRGICDKKILVYCETEDEDEEFCKVANTISESKYTFFTGDSFYNVHTIDDESIEMEYWGSGEEGYQIIPYSEFFNDEEKPLEDWTLKEVKEYCPYRKAKDDNLQHCETCKFIAICGICADEWEFEQPLELTDSEIEILKAIKVLYPMNDNIFYDTEFDMFTNNSKGFGLIQINASRLQSLSKDKEYSISSLLEGVE